LALQGVFPAILEFAVLLLAIYVATVALYFAVGFSIEWFNRRNEARRIQKSRRGELRRRAEMMQSMASIFVTCLSLASGLFAQQAGWTPTPWRLTWWNAILLFLLTMVLFDAWFYFAHRLLHTKPFYRFHQLHHRSFTPTVWSNDSIGLVDTALSQGFYAIVVFFIPLPPLILIANRLFDQINGTFGHAGFEYFASGTARAPSPMLCTTYHDQHHAEFKYNFANYFSFWDRLMGTVAPDYDARVAAFEAQSPALNFSLKRAAAPEDNSSR
jgi:sterol desaturase/sphingolipid hydroxylase (fatty acid hydroxylase superfamily)